MSQANIPTTELSNLTDSLAANTAPSFAGGGKIITDMGGYEGSSTVAVQADGKILLGGSSVNGFALMRYNSDGSLDLSFAGDGIVTTGVADVSYGNSVVVQTDGKVLLGGYSYNISGGRVDSIDFTLVRYNTDGSLDLSFDGDGIVTTAGGEGYSVTVQTDGKILLGGWSSNNDFALVRYNADGSLDLSFDGDGIVTTFVSGYDRGSSVTVQADGKILLGGGNHFSLVRYNSDGSLDNSFDGDGIVTTEDYYYGNSVTVQTDGKILLGGGGFSLVRYNSDGSLDLSFSGDGKVTTNLGYGNGSIIVQADGKILQGGSKSTGNSSANSDFALVRYNADGSPDNSFDGDGIVTTDLGQVDYGSPVTVQADGKILLGGGSDYDFALLRYNSDGSLDNSFNPLNTINSQPSYTENSAAVVLDDTVQIYDTELAAQGSYNGTSITLARHGGAHAEDVFSGSGLLSFSGSAAVLSGVTIGTVSNSNGTLSINFNSKATPARVDAVLSSIAYNNTADYPPLPSDSPTTPSASVQIDWTFNDGNTGAQGTGDALTTTESSIINIFANQTYSELIGTAGNDSINGRTRAEKIYGFAGNDSLNGGSGADSLLGGLGDDLYSVDRGSDKVIENLDEGTDTVISSSTYNLPANVENLTLIGTASIGGKGNDLANTLIGNDANNRLSGGAGADTLSGGLGADIFKFNTEVETGITATTRDSIVAFSHDQGDKINLAAIDANTAFKGNNVFASPTVGGAFSGTFAHPGELYFDQTTHILYGNNDADSTADFSIKVMGVTSLAAADFVL